MKTSSCKAKGRKLQQAVRDALRTIGQPYGLEDGDIESIGMGQNGCDIILSPAAKRIFNLAIECKNVEKLQVVPTFIEHYQTYKKQEGLKLLFHSKNFLASKIDDIALVTMRAGDLISMIATLVSHEHKKSIGFKAKK